VPGRQPLRVAAELEQDIAAGGKRCVAAPPDVD
jgi:hypothetical protein